MISKEERAELRGLIGQAAAWPLPWQACGDATSDALVFSANEAQEEHIAEFTSNYSCDLAVAAVNAAPKLLAALDAADKRIEGLEALRDAHRDARERADAREDALKARIAELETTATEQAELWKLREKEHDLAVRMMTRRHREVVKLRARIAELEAAAHYDAWLLSGDTGMSSKAIFDFMRTGTKGGWTPSDPSDLGRCLRLLERFPEWRERMPEMSECSPKWARMMPYWGALEASLLREVGGLHTDGSAPETYQMMKAIERGNGPALPIPALPEGGV